MSKEVVLTGLRSNAEFHLGNYLGGILPMVELQKKHTGKFQLNMFIPDLHSFTTPIDHGRLYQQTFDNLKVFVAAGLDINEPDTFIYRQSYIPAHSELTWILSCFVGFGELRRMEQFESKTGLSRGQNARMSHLAYERSDVSFEDALQQMNREELLNDLTQYKALLERHHLNNRKLASRQITAGLFSYPVLMAADILLYGAKYVPVGEDQRQHLEFTRDLAMRLNNKFGELFVVPEDNQKQMEFAGRSNPVRIRSLRNPEKKMSKSVEDPAGTIMLTDTPEEAAKKIMSATTDSIGEVHFDFEKQPGISNLLQILALTTNRPQAEVNDQFKGQASYGELKSVVAEAVRNLLVELQGRLSQIDEQSLIQKLEADEDKMRQVASETLLRVQKAVGLRP